MRILIVLTGIAVLALSGFASDMAKNAGKPTMTTSVSSLSSER
jgi:hypothetical protein